MIRRPPRSTLDRSSAASDVYKRQEDYKAALKPYTPEYVEKLSGVSAEKIRMLADLFAVSYTHLRAHETVLDLVCRLLLEKKKRKKCKNAYNVFTSRLID